jgi:peptidoglycan/xylan/chitin deacetylase (PgdA/CDA1 family)
MKPLVNLTFRDDEAWCVLYVWVGRTAAYLSCGQAQFSVIKQPLPGSEVCVTTRFCLSLPVDPTAREVSRLYLVARAMKDRIACVCGPDLAGRPAVRDMLSELGIPLVRWSEIEQNRQGSESPRFDAVISIADTLSSSPPPAEIPTAEIPAPLGTWGVFEGDPRTDRGPVGFAQAIDQGRKRVAMTLRRAGDTADGGDLLAFADAPRRPWDSLAGLQKRLDAYLPQMIEDACERIAEAGGGEFSLGRFAPPDSAPKSRRLMEMLKDAKFLTHILFTGLAPLFAKQRTIMLLVHNPPPDILDRMLAKLRQIGPFVPYSRVVSDLRHGRPLTPGFVLTFDDGYKENMALLDVLDRHQCKAMFFLNTSVIDRKSALWFMNPDSDFLAKKENLRSLDYASFLAAADHEGLTGPSPLRGRFGLRSEDVRALLARGHEIGVHTHNHPFLTRLTDQEIRTEVSECRERLRSISGDRTLPFHFAYPDGDHDERVVAVLEGMGARSAVTTRPSPVDNRSHLLKIPRYQLGDLDYPGLSLFKLTAAFPALNAARQGVTVPPLGS